MFGLSKIKTRSRVRCVGPSQQNSRYTQPEDVVSICVQGPSLPATRGRSCSVALVTSTRMPPKQKEMCSLRPQRCRTGPFLLPSDVVPYMCSRHDKLYVHTLVAQSNPLRRLGKWSEVSVKAGRMGLGSAHKVPAPEDHDNRPRTRQRHNIANMLCIL